jgi:4-amino-4-deoxy-L-arabinose transferase-like glycosyltransferase
MTNRALWGLILGFMALHLLLAGLLPLVEDEAYYQLWASNPAAGYYDHPPMIAWWIAAGQMLFGQTALGVRFVPVLAGALVTLLIYRIAFLFSEDGRIAFRAALWGKVMIPFSVLAFAATPDAPSILFWTAAIWALAEVKTGRSANWWLLVGLFAGLGVLSKFTNLFFGLSLVIWLLASREGRGWLKTWQVWAGALIGIGVLLPFLWWNMQNGWIGLERQFGRLGVDEGFSLSMFAGFWAALVVLVTPLLFWQVGRSLLSGRVPGVLIWLTAPVFLYMAYYATQATAGAQWLLPAYPALAVIAALGSGQGRVLAWIAPSGLGLSVLTLVIGLWPWKVLVPGHNPFTQGRGWPPVVAEIREQAKATGAVWIATEAYGLDAQLNHYLGQELPVWSVRFPERYLFRGDFPAALCDAPGLFVSRQKSEGSRPELFATYEPLPTITRRSAGTQLMTYEVARVTGVATNICP